MKNTAVKILLTLALIATAYAGAKILSFTVTNDNGNVKLEWKTSDEQNVKDFLVQRHAQGTDWATIGTVQTNSSGDYTYIDSDIYKNNGSTYYYRIGIEDYSGVITYVEYQSPINPNISSVKRTWGSIKAMFR